MDELSAKRLASILFDSDDTFDGESGFPSIPGYAIDELLGQGGGGDVYGGTVESTGRPVAIKLLHTNLARNARDAFRELDRLASIRSSVVPHVLDYGWHNDQIYIVTERISGLDPIAYSQGLSIKERVRLLASIADAVSTLHARGVLHRDIKPSNILITEDGTPVILDLGIASLVEEAPQEHDGVVRGTDRYMCPEQAAGQNSESTTSWDVYALGVLGLELILSERFDPETGSQEILNRLPKRLRPVLRAAIATDPENRYETAQQLRDDLEAWLNRQPIYAERSRLWSRVSRLFSARPILTITTLCLLIMLSSIIASGLLVLWQNTKPYRFETVMNSGGQSMLTLFALNGRIIRQWQVQGNNAINKTNQLVQYQGRDLAIVGLMNPDLNSGHEGLIVYEAGNWETPLWVAEQQVTPEMAHVTRFDSPPHRFRHLRHYLFDVFSSEPGDEIVSLHRHVPSSLCAIQVHSLDGRLLSEYYHDGWVRSAAWLPAQQQLVLAGQNSDGTWVDRGAATLPAGKYPMVIFAITPELGSIGNTIEHPGLGVGKPADWYRCLTPPEAYDPFCANTIGPLHNLRLSPKPDLAEQGVVIWQLGGDINASQTLGHATLVIDRNGKLRDAWSTDTWNGNSKYGLTPAVYQLEDLPPRTEPRKHEPLQPPTTEPVPSTP